MKKTIAPPRPTARVQAALGLMAVLPLAASFGFYDSFSRYQEANRDPYRIAVQAERFRPAAAALPAGVVVGYLSDLPAGETAGKAAFLSAQYALAPRLLVDPRRDPPPERAVGNFSRPLDYAAAGRPLGLEVERDLGNGVVLFKRAGN